MKSKWTWDKRVLLMRVWMCVNVKEEPKCNFFMCCSCVLSTWMWIATRVASHFDIENTVLSLLFCVHRTPNPIALKCVFAPSFGPSFISPQRTCFFMCACCLIKYFWARLTYFTFKFLLRWTYRISRESFFLVLFREFIRISMQFNWIYSRVKRVIGLPVN